MATITYLRNSLAIQAKHDSAQRLVSVLYIKEHLYVDAISMSYLERSRHWL